MISCFQVTVRDDGRPPLSSTTRVVIEVADVNDHGPEFEAKFYTVQIPASPATDKPLFQVRISLRILSCITASSQLIVSPKFLVNTFPRRRMDRVRTKRSPIYKSFQSDLSPLSLLLYPRVKSITFSISLYIRAHYL